MSIKDALAERDCVISDLAGQVREARAEVARLEDLRRWRPMSDIEAAKRANCVLAERLPKDEDVCRVVIATVHRDRWVLVGSGDVIREGFYADWQWTYIPGQEPKEEA